MPHRPSLHRPHANTHHQPRAGAGARGYGAAWRKTRAAHLAEHPLCQLCLPRLVVATVVDHITPVTGPDDPTFHTGPFQSLCAACHRRKSAAEDGALGNPRKGNT